MNINSLKTPPTADRINKKAESVLTNGCNLLKTGKLFLALTSHHAVKSCTMSSLTPEELKNDVWGGSELTPFNIKEIEEAQERIHVNFIANGKADHTALVYVNYDLIPILRTDNTDVPELVCMMKRNKFFKYLQTIPNMYEFAEFDKPMLGCTLEGLYLFELSTKYE